MPESPYRMISVETAIATVLGSVSALAPVRLPFLRSPGLVIAEDVYAAEAMPPFAASAVDGYAVIADDDSATRQVTGEQTAGRISDIRVVPGTAVRVMTGAPMPIGADAVVMLEDTREELPDRVALTAAVTPGSNVRPVGQDLAAGQLVLTSGTQLCAPEIGLLATVGRTDVMVHPRPRVAVMSTGDELVEPGIALQAGQIRDSNRFSMLCAVREAGGEPIDLGRIHDRPDAVRDVLERAFRQSDAVLTSGGVSMGQMDLIKPYLASRGTVHFGRVRARPGKPVTFATVDGMPVFAMPGFPVSALVSFEIYVRPALLKMAGHRNWQRPRHAVRLEHAIEHETGRTEFQRAVVTRHPDGRYTAHTTGFQGSGRLLSLVGANALLILPAEQAAFAAGDQVEALITGAPSEAGTDTDSRQ